MSDLIRTVFREANLKDIDGINLCNKVSLPIYYSKTELIFLLLNSDIGVIVAQYNQNIIGYAIFEKQANNAHIISIAVYPKFRSHGVGSKLIKKICIDCKKLHNIKTLTLFVHSENGRGIKFYKKNGFKKTETLKDYYRSALKNCKNYDAFKMFKKINL